MTRRAAAMKSFRKTLTGGKIVGSALMLLTLLHTAAVNANPTDSSTNGEFLLHRYQQTSINRSNTVCVINHGNTPFVYNPFTDISTPIAFTDFFVFGCNFVFAALFFSNLQMIVCKTHVVDKVVLLRVTDRSIIVNKLTLLLKIYIQLLSPHACY